MTSIRDTRQTRVKLFPTAGPSRIECFYSNIKEIRVFISIGSSIGENISIKHCMLKDFMNMILDHSIPEIEANNDLPDDIVRLFVSISRQIDNGRSIYEVIDASGRPILNEPTSSRTSVHNQHNIGNTQYGADTNDRVGVTGLTSELTDLQYGRNQRNTSYNTTHPNIQQQSIPQRDVFNHTLQRLMGSITSGLSNRSSVDRQALSGMVSDMNVLYQNLPTNALTTGNNTQPTGNNTQPTGNNTQPTGNNSQFASASPYTSPYTSIRDNHTIQQNIPIPPNPSQVPYPTQQSAQSGTSNVLSNMVRMLAAMTPRPYEVNPTHQGNDQVNPTPNPVRMLRNISNPQTVEPEDLTNNILTTDLSENKQSATSIESEMPRRFVESKSAVREVIINPADEQTDTNQTNDDHNTDRFTDATLETEYKERINTLPRLSPMRHPIQHETIVKLATHIHNLVVNKKTRSPDFTNLTKSGYRKIKNYIHNITGVWLSQEEINEFTSVLDKLRQTTHQQQSVEQSSSV